MLPESNGKLERVLTFTKCELLPPKLVACLIMTVASAWLETIIRCVVTWEPANWRLAKRPERKRTSARRATEKENAEGALEARERVPWSRRDAGVEDFLM